jgi:hypothetical protein
MGMCGTTEALIPVNYREIAAEVGIEPRTMQWRKPLHLSEIARMAPTPEVRERAGRP